MRVASGQVLEPAKAGVAQGTGLPSLPQLGQGEELGGQDRREAAIPAHPAQERLPTGAGAFLSADSSCPCAQLEWHSQLCPLVHWE